VICCALVRGRKPKPTRLKLVAGNPGKRPLKPREPKPEVKVPICPAHLCPAAKAVWKRLTRELFVLGLARGRCLPHLRLLRLQGALTPSDQEAKLRMGGLIGLPKIGQVGERSGSGAF
jgi:phage terminase small subunit